MISLADEIIVEEVKATIGCIWIFARFSAAF